MPAADRSLADVVAALERLEAAEFTHERLEEILGSRPIRESSFAPRVRFRDDKYARHSIRRTDLFDVILLCWKPGQLSPVHNHQGNSGWVRVLRGRMEETHFQPPSWVVAGVPMPGGGSAAGAAGGATFDIDDDGVGHGIELQRGQHFVHVAGPAVCSVDRQRPIHQLGNPKHHASDEPAVTLHVYSRPHDACLAFDTTKKTCWRVELAFDTTADGAARAR
jgi:cysteine dioxygenase